MYCKECKDYTDFDVEDPNVGGLGYMTKRCTSCHSCVACCNFCSDRIYSIHARKHTNIKNHMKRMHDTINSTTVVHQQSVQEPLCEVIRDNGESSIEENYNNDCFLDLDYHEANDELSLRSFTIHDDEYPNFGNSISDTYFGQDYNMYHDSGELFGGLRGITWRSRYRLDLHEETHLADLKDTEFMFNITQLVTIYPTSANRKLYQVLTGMTDRMPGDFDSENPNVRLPRNEKDADRTCLNGQFGIFNNLPCPNIHDIGGHACMKIGDVIAHHLAMGRRVEFTESPTGDRIYNGIHGCEAMQDLIDKMKSYFTDNESYYAWLTTWSDSFLRSYVKQKHNNVWMYTITLPDPDRNATSPLHTYCVAVGAGALDHTAVIDWYASEVEELMRGKTYYDGFRKEFVHVKFGVVAGLADRPEKAWLLKTSLLGDYGRIASWAAEIVPNILADCKTCFTRRCASVMKDRHSKSIMRPCSLCCQWDLNSESQSRTKVLVPKDYPTVIASDSPKVPMGREIGAKYVTPVKQTFQWLEEAVHLASHNVSAGVWRKGVMVAYLRTCSVATSVRDNLWKRCRPGATDTVVNDEEDDDGTNDGEVNDGFVPIVSDESNVVPAIWRSALMMNAFLDCGMHLVFHGIVAYCVEMMDAFLADHAMTPKFERLVNVYLVDIQALRLDWCKMKFFPKKQWLAENELALARIIPFVFGLLFLNLELPERCNTSENTRIAIMQMFQSMHVMICILMSPRDPLAPEIDEHVKMFLSCCHRYSRSYYDKDVRPFWANTGNFPTLLCLAEQRQRHGPIRWYWEGTSERFIQQLKKVLVSMRKTTEYFAGKLSRMYRTNVMDWLDEELSKEINSTSRKSTRRTPRMYYQYKTLDEIKMRINVGSVLSGFSFKGNDDKILVAYGEKRRSGIMNCIGISRLNKGHASKCIGLAYVQCSLDDQTELLLDVHVQTVEKMIQNYCLLLPFVEDETFTNKFAIIYDDWDCGDEYFVKCLPSICPFCFSTDVMS